MGDFNGVFSFDLLGVLLGMNSRTNWYQNLAIWLRNKDFWVERIECSTLRILSKWPRCCVCAICAFWAGGIESCLTKTRSLLMKTRSLFQEGSMLDPKIIFASFNWFFTLISGLIMPKMIMQEWLCICIYDIFLMNQWIMMQTILPKMWKWMLMIFIFQSFSFSVR